LRGVKREVASISSVRSFGSFPGGRKDKMQNGATTGKKTLPPLQPSSSICGVLPQLLLVKKKIGGGVIFNCNTGRRFRRGERRPLKSKEEPIWGNICRNLLLERREPTLAPVQERGGRESTILFGKSSWIDSERPANLESLGERKIVRVESHISRLGRKRGVERSC